ncbi:unnamed protein product [Kuraishia capsulata CBS 1993]|uniref:Histone deacetylase domain-containing protein n=1 Tax=Kuraishia capsulata CBS 1993 TaxID=1382522 RepID=W6MIJ7_9ASCO|nr:uncharacterized protein KUCA_T00000142001 [Kuraishia capsulata CBS 1993]CDK24182.1 unnamed protein product [Kuraishia capsulata CBS 1993]
MSDDILAGELENLKIRDSSPALASSPPKHESELSSSPPRTPEIKKENVVKFEESKPEEYVGVDELQKFRETFFEFIEQFPEIVEQQEVCNIQDKALVILSPLSVKHRFGRDWVSKAYISSIVERPQRLLAVSIGISAALSMFPSYYTFISSTTLGALDSPHVLKVHGRKWLDQIVELCAKSTAKLENGEIEVPDEWNSGDIYLTADTLLALKGVVGAVETAVDQVHSSKANSGEAPKRAFVAIRPPGHHSHPCTPSGFCLINNAQIAILYAHAKFDVTHAVILDIDLHHGDGTQDICWEQGGFKADYGDSEDSEGYDEYEKRAPTGPKVGYFSLHDINSFPTELGYATSENVKNASLCLMGHDMCIWNVHLQPYKTQAEFDDLYYNQYCELFKRAEMFLKKSKLEHDEKILEARKRKQPIPAPFKALVVMSSGFDGSEFETQTMQRHKVNVPTSFYARFTSDTVNLANSYSEGRLISFLEGGYSDAALSSGVFAHMVGLQQQKWDESWGKDSLVKELVKGCRPKWTPVKAPRSDVSKWANWVCRMGRDMVPDAVILPTASKPVSGLSSLSGSNVYATRATRMTTRSHAQHNESEKENSTPAASSEDYPSSPMKIDTPIKNNSVASTMSPLESARFLDFD